MYTTGDYFEVCGKHIPPEYSESVREADYALALGEQVNFALLSSFMLDGNKYSGVVAVTTHRILCCSSVNHNTTFVTLPYSACVGIGNTKGIIFRNLPIVCDNISVDVKAAGIDIDLLRGNILTSIEASPNQKPIAFAPSVRTISVEEYKRVQKEKNAHHGERRLTESESREYSPCPECKGTVIVERNGQIYCSKCGNSFK